MHESSLTTQFLPHAISYNATELLNAIIGRKATYLIYVFVVIAPLLISSDRDARIFGVLVAGVLAVTYFFFQYAFISVFCVGGAIMSLYLVIMIFRKAPVPGLA